MRHLNLFTFTIRELHYYRLFKISTKFCSEYLSAATRIIQTP